MGVLTAWITPMVTPLPHCTALHSCFCRKERGQALTELSGRDFNQIPGSRDFLGWDFTIFLSYDFIIAPFSFGFFSYCCIIAFFFVGWFHISLLGRCINFSIVHNENNQRSTKTLHYYTKKQRWLKDIRYKVTCAPEIKEKTELDGDDRNRQWRDGLGRTPNTLCPSSR